MDDGGVAYPMWYYYNGSSRPTHVNGSCSSTMGYDLGQQLPTADTRRDNNLPSALLLVE
jgi:hypothetical protein